MLCVCIKNPSNKGTLVNGRVSDGSESNRYDYIFKAALKSGSLFALSGPEPQVLREWSS